MMTTSTTRRVALASLSALLIAVGTAACTGSDSTSAPTLASGTYQFVASDVPIDSCWPGLAVFPPQDIAIQPFQVNYDDVSGAISLVRPTNLQSVVPVLSGTRVLNAIVTSGSTLYVASSNCTLRVSGQGAGSVTAIDRIDLDFTTQISGATTATTGSASNCTALDGTSPNGIPFPVLDPPNNGACNVTIRGALTPYP